MPPSHSIQHGAGRSGFTLVELLVVIAIVGVLAGILFPVIGEVRSQADDARCKSALRQYGAAMQLYIGDNRGRFPGPCYGFVKRNGLVEGSGHLFSFLIPYIGLTGDSMTKLPDAFVCPGLLRDAVNPDNANLAVYKISNRVQVGSNASNKDTPFGYPGHSQPYLYSQVTSFSPPPRTWCLCDVDQVNGSLDASGSSLPAKPVHGDHRNALYLDWHVGSVSIVDSNI